MEKELARALLMMVNDHDKYESLQKYVAYRIEVLRNYLETTRDHEKVLEMQGSISELRKLQTLREQVIEGAK